MGSIAGVEELLRMRESMILMRAIEMIVISELERLPKTRYFVGICISKKLKVRSSWSQSLTCYRNPGRHQVS